MNLFKNLFVRRQQRKEAARVLDRFAKAAGEFAETYKDALVIIGDPQSDVIFMACGGIIAPVRILNKDGSRNHIVANALKHNRGDADIDRFLLAVDGGMFQIARGLYDMRRRSVVGKVVGFVKGEEVPVESAVTLADGSTLSPVQLIEK